jgi:hypothetical protein
MGHFLGMNSRVHPKYKIWKHCFQVYRVSNWAKYDRALVERGNITLWASDDAIASWKPASAGRRGGQRKFSDHAIETALMLRLVFKLPLRQPEGFLWPILSLTDIDLEAPNPTTLLRRSQGLNVQLDRVAGDNSIHLIVDRTGLSMVGEGEWAAAQYGGRGRRGWKKLHLGVDRTGVIVSQTLTHGSADDARVGVDLIDGIEDEMGFYPFSTDSLIEATSSVSRCSVLLVLLGLWNRSM